MTVTDSALDTLPARMAADGFAFPFEAVSTVEAADLLGRVEEYEAAAVRQGGVWAAFRHFPKIHLVAEWADQIVRHPRILAVVSRLLGPDLLVWSTNLFTRPAGSDAVLAWHQDALQYELDGYERGAVRVWLALTDTSLANGTMRFAPGTHRDGLLAHRTGADPAVVRERGLEVDIEVDERDAVPVLLRAGQFSLHHMAVAHASGPNSTGTRRVNFAIDYLAPSVRPVGGPDSAMPVLGEDRYGHFAHETRLAPGSAAAQRQFAGAVMARMRRLERR